MHIRIVGASKPPLRVLIEAALRSVHHHSIHTVGWVDSTAIVLESAREWQADLVILDPGMDRGNLLHQWPSLVGSAPILLCWSASARYAAPAFAAGAVHYLTAEASGADIQEALDRVAERMVRHVRPPGGVDPQKNVLREMVTPFRRTTIAMPGYDGIEVRPARSVVSAHGYDGYTRIHLLEEPPVILSKSLGEMEGELRAAGLLRVHRSHMVNPALIRRVLRGKTPRVVMITGEHVDVSPRYRDILYEALCLSSARRGL